MESILGTAPISLFRCLHYCDSRFDFESRANLRDFAHERASFFCDSLRDFGGDLRARLRGCNPARWENHNLRMQPVVGAAVEVSSDAVPQPVRAVSNANGRYSVSFATPPEKTKYTLTVKKPGFEDFHTELDYAIEHRDVILKDIESHKEEPKEEWRRRETQQDVVESSRRAP